jgi:hypothetical protein
MKFTGIASGTAAIAVGIVAAASLPAMAQEAMFVRTHRGLQVLIQPIARITDTIVFREIYKDRGEKGSANSIYAFDCKARALRYVDLDDNRVIKEAEFYDGAYKKAHDKFCTTYKDPRG